MLCIPPDDWHKVSQCMAQSLSCGLVSLVPEFDDINIYSLEYEHAVKKML